MIHYYFFRFILFVGMNILVNSLFPQTNLSGVVNSYDEVTGFSAFNNSVTVTNPGMWAIGDRVVLIQMNGATVNTSNSSSFGTVTNYNNTGSYEIATICLISGSQVVFDYLLRNTYSPTLGKVQMVKIALVSGNVNIQDTVRAQNWNGTTGGIVAIEATGKVTVNKPIIADGQGFRGGGYENSTLTNCRSGFFNPPAPSSYAYGSGDDGGEKGEGIAVLPVSQQHGKGPVANGGGGGNDHNTGGAGGGHSGLGGQGGEHRNTAFGCNGSNHGLGGLSLSFFVSGFMGGGGGAGHGNNLGGGGGGTSGGNGGGIVIIVATQIEGGTEPLISAEGESVTTDAQADGAGGGGAGGMIHLQALLINGGLTIRARGGDGGDVNNQALTNGRCFGPGGGGAGGVIKIGSGTTAGATFLNGGGNPGISFNSTGNCNNSSEGALGGGGGAVLFGTNIQRSLIDFAACSILPVEWLYIEGEQLGDDIRLSWEMANTSIARKHYITRENSDGIFTIIDSVNGSITRFIDEKPLPGMNRYRLKAVDINGKTNQSFIVEVFRSSRLELHLHKNPIHQGTEIKLTAVVENQTSVHLRVQDIQGRSFLERSFDLNPGENVIQMPVNSLAKGTYFLHAETANGRKVLPVVIQ